MCDVLLTELNIEGMQWEDIYEFVWMENDKMLCSHEYQYMDIWIDSESMCLVVSGDMCRLSVKSTTLCYLVVFTIWPKACGPRLC